MSEKLLFCQTLLQGKEWRHGVMLSLDGQGYITGIVTGTRQEADQVINGLVVPGMPNLHSHSFQRAIAGRTGPNGAQTDSFWSWREAMYRCANQITPAQFAALASSVFVEMLKAGYTSCAEFHYIHHQPGGDPYSNPAEMSERVLEAASETGIGMTLLPVFYNCSGFGETTVAEQQRRFYNSTDQYLRLLESCQEMVAGETLLHCGFAPHSLRAVCENRLQEALQAQITMQGPVHIHIAEQTAEIEGSLKYLGARPVEWLLENFPVDARWCLVHATHLTSQELQEAAAREVVVGLCPTTEADLGDGIFRTSDWLVENGRLGIGSDSNIRISVSEELRMLEYNERLQNGQRNVLKGDGSTCGSYLYQHAALNGGKAIDQAVGQLEVGFRADMLVLDEGHNLLSGRTPDVAMDSWIFAGDQSMIQSVWVAGRCLIEHGRHKLDVEICAAAASAMHELNNR